MGEKLNLMKAGLSRAERLMQRVGTSNTVGAEEWKEFGSCLGDVQKWSSRAENSLWVLRLTRDPHSTTSEALELGENASAAVGKCLSAIALVPPVDIYNTALSSGLTPEEGAALVALLDYETAFPPMSRPWSACDSPKSE